MVDCASDSLEMDYEAMARAITERTKAVIPVDLGGVPCDYDIVFAVLEAKRDLFHPASDIQEALGRVAVCEDAAHALGSTYHGQMIGSIADFTSFSFHAVKNFTTAEGGCLAWNLPSEISDEEVYRKVQLLSLHGQSKDALAKTKLGAWEYDVLGPWYKCNMTDIQAALGLVQLKRYQGMLDRRKELIALYDSYLGPLGVESLPHYGDDCASSGHLYICRVPNITPEQRNEIIEAMAERGVATNVHYKPLPMMTAYKDLGFDIADYPRAYARFANEITLPLHTCLSDEEAHYAASSFAEIVEGVRWRPLAWDALPEEMRNEWVRPYYEALAKKRVQLVGKRCFDVALSTILLVLLSPAFLILAIAIKLDSPGPVFYRQERVTQYGKRFHIFKFRTMCDRADQMGSAVTTGGDAQGHARRRQDPRLSPRRDQPADRHCAGAGDALWAPVRRCPAMWRATRPR